MAVSGCWGTAFSEMVMVINITICENHGDHDCIFHCHEFLATTSKFVNSSFVAVMKELSICYSLFVIHAFIVKACSGVRTRIHELPLQSPALGEVIGAASLSYDVAEPVAGLQRYLQ